ncbi:GerAB/ArcD/ProY family transporter [Oceanirhabdus sp. W0125-5]|uniref:GerAB/ArcD/ProY family transporter n=1 Tax=Oceanirhabdus sp. W0125-5 TaxID=2999116 RepID=UPI0022F322F1|nr:GerAB/ArcD/ProY family transporter [Oceanirhabdus sp. W0125-5]WBW99650.1 GerAB/ArcD/ProY family transporter [Oceanirhabdus sp. W0125-5]
MKPKLNLYQLFILMVLLPYGTAILFYLGAEAKQDAWIAMLIYSLGGIILQLIYTTLFYKYPKDTLVTYLPKIYGKVLGSILSVIYISYFTYIGSRNIRDFLEIIKITQLSLTPMIYTGIIFTLIVIYSVNNGLKTIASTAQFFFIIIIFVPFLVWGLLLLMENVLNPSNLRPVLQDGIISIIKKGWPLITFPYGETILFTMIYPYVSKPEKVRKVAILSIIFEGIILSLSTILLIITLGVPQALNALCPFFDVVQRIDLVEFLTRLDVLFVILLMIGGFFKVSLFMYVSVMGILQIISIKDFEYKKIKLKNTEIVSFFIGIIMLFLALIMAKNYLHHLDIGLDFVIKYIHLPLQIVIPILTLLICFLKTGHKTNQGSKT